MFCSQQNDTYISPSLKDVGLEMLLRIVGRNKIVGNLGQCYETLLIRQPLRKCRIIGLLDIGKKLANSTYTGVLGMLQSKRADLYVRAEPDYLHEDWLTKSVPIHMENVVLGHPIRDQKLVSYFNLLNNFKLGIGLFSFYLLSFLGILAFSFLIDKLNHRIRPEEKTAKLFKRLASLLTGFEVKRFSAIGVFFLFVHLFLWVTRLFLTNNIKTNKVVLDTSQLIKDVHDIFSSRRVACFVADHQLHNMIISSPTRNILWRIFNEKTRLRADMKEERNLLKSDRCLVLQELTQIATVLKSADDVFFVEERRMADLLFASRLLDGQVKKAWLNQKLIFEYNQVLYYNGEKPGIGRMIIDHTEAGLIGKTYDCFEKLARSSCRLANIAVFQSLDDFVREHSHFSDLVLDNFRHMFNYYALFCSFILAAFCGHHLIRFAKKKIKLSHF